MSLFDDFLESTESNTDTRLAPTVPATTHISTVDIVQDDQKLNTVNNATNIAPTKANKVKKLILPWVSMFRIELNFYFIS